MAVTTVVLGADKAGDLTRAIALMVASGSVGVARIHHDAGCPTLAGKPMRDCTCAEVNVEIQPLEVPR